MSLIKCNECKKEVSDKATACPKCGNPIQSQNTNRFCIECGNEIGPNDVKCKYCYSILQKNNIVYVERKNNSMAITGFVLSIVSILLPILAIPGFIFSCIGLSQCSKRNEKGYGLATAGFIISLFFLLVIFLSIIFGIVAYIA